jgi:hypothetical protein
VDEAYVVAAVLVASDGHAEDVTIIHDPGYGFGDASKQCAMHQQYVPGRNAGGVAIESRTKPFRIHYSRPRPAGE